MKMASLLTILMLATPAFATDWSMQAKSLSESIVYIESAAGSCTGFVINNEKNLILTAAHCDGGKLFADQSPAKVVAKDVKSDLLVLSVEDLDRPALKLALKNPSTGQEAATFGYGYGLEQPLFRASHISQEEAQISDLPYEYVMVDNAFLPGQSGGPVVNLNGDVVSIVQRGNDSIGIGVGAELIKSKMGKHFGR